MRVRPPVAALILGAFVFCSLSAAAASRVTTVDGREALVRPSAAASHPRAAMLTARKPGTHAIINVSAGADTDAANNDYRRIQNALNGAGAGDTIILSGTFNFAAPFAAAAWALGNDNTAGTGDDYSVYVPAGLNNITFTAASLGSATIQGPGDLATVDLEGFLYFDGGGNLGWTISNLQIFDFDLGIGMFNGAGSYDGTIIQNNLIRVAADLNATVAPADAFQNIAIHFAPGINQSILNNTIQLNGGNPSDGANRSSEVGMQSNTTGGAFYDGLTIAGNSVHVLNAQAVDPARVIGFWENGHAHTSDILIQNNSFVNDAAGNNPALNAQQAIRVTSHSSALTTVTYNLNTVTGANIAVMWLAGTDFTGNTAVIVSNNVLTNSGTGILVQSNGVAHVTHNTITGSGAGGGLHVITGTLTGTVTNTNSAFRNYISGGSGDGVWIEATAGAVAPMSQNNLSGNAGFGFRNESVPAIVVERNWWGSNLAAAVAAEVSGNADFDPWLASGTDINPIAAFQPFNYATTSGVITTLLGTGVADTGTIVAGDPVTMIMNGETAFTALAQLLNFDIQLGGADDTLTLGATGIPTVLDMGAGINDLLNGPNSPIVYNVTGANSGNAPPLLTSFTGVEGITAGTAADSFVFAVAATLSGAINGNLGLDTLTVPAGSAVITTGPGTLDGVMGTATPIAGGFNNINAIVGSPADLSVVKSGPASVNVGTPIAYPIAVTNIGPNPGLSVTLTDVLPAGTTFVSLIAPGGWGCATPAVGGTGTVTCTIASLGLGVANFTLNVTAPATPAALSNTAVVTSVNEGAAGNESSTANTTVNGLADLSVVKNGPAAVNVSTPIAFTIDVTATGTSPALTVALNDTLPAGTTFLSLVPAAGWTCSTPAVGSGGLVNCTIASLAPGTASFTLNVTAPAVPASVTNTAIVTSTNESAAGNESDSATTTVNGLADLSVTKSGPASVNAGAAFSYTIAVTNTGTNAALNVSLSDVLPAGVTFTSIAAAAGWNCTTPPAGSNGTVTCTNASFAPGVASFTLNVTAPLSTGSVGNTAVVTSSNEAAAGNESSTATTTLNGVADLSIAKTGPPQLIPNSTFSYSILVTNNGPLAATNVVVTDVLPAGVTFQSAIASQGSCSGTSTVTCTLGGLANGGTASITLTVLVTATTGTISNTASVAATEVDPTPTNSATAAAAVAETIPTASTLGLFALGALLAGLAIAKIRS
jgi:uncharacterized repeat protein (TIGR01451 family)